MLMFQSDVLARQPFILIKITMMKKVTGQSCPLPRQVLLLLHVLLLFSQPCHSLSTSPGSIGGGASKQQQQSPKAKRPSAPRARGSAWSANHNRNGYSTFRGSKDEVIKTKNRKKPPRWETEGDSLYHLIQQDDDTVEYATPDDELKAAKDMLKNAFLQHEENTTVKRPVTRSQAKKDAKEEAKKAPPSHMMWGSCSVGPILKSRLTSDDLDSPTLIQEAAFPVLATQKMRPNTIIASPTGTGKTLAYLLPLLAVLQQKKPYSLLIVTPTVELAVQIQKQIDNLWSLGSDGMSSCQVVQSQKEEPIFLGRAPILVGTPRSLRQLLTETKAKNYRLFAELQGNLKTIVLDEADRLLRTEGAARDTAQSAAGASIKEQIRRKHQKKKQTASPTELLLREFKTLHYSYSAVNRVQLICASATVGRTLRRQIMALTNAPSMDKAAVLVTADGRTTKDAARRKASLLPDTIQHYYVYSTGQTSKGETVDTVDLMWDTMKRLPPAPILLFPGKTGVMPIVEGLQSKYGLKDVRTLRENTAKDGITTTTTAKKWKDTTIYVVGEKFGRGLDLEGSVSYVLLSSPPSSPAAYLHLAGRTGRNGQAGKAITIVQSMKEAKLVPALAMGLGITFDDLEPAVGTDNKELLVSNTAAPITEEITESEVSTETATVGEGIINAPTNHPWQELSKSAVMKKTVAEIVEYLTERVSPHWMLYSHSCHQFDFRTH